MNWLSIQWASSIHPFSVCWRFFIGLNFEDPALEEMLLLWDRAGDRAGQGCGEEWSGAAGSSLDPIHGCQLI